MTEIFRERNGKLSMMRVLVFVIVLVMLANYTFITVSTGKLPTADFGSIVTLVLALGAKGMQRMVETDGPNAK